MEAPGFGAFDSILGWLAYLSRQSSCLRHDGIFLSAAKAIVSARADWSLVPHWRFAALLTLMLLPTACGMTQWESTNP